MGSAQGPTAGRSAPGSLSGISPRELPHSHPQNYPTMLAWKKQEAPHTERAKFLIQQVLGCWGSQLRRLLLQYPWILGSILPLGVLTLCTQRREQARSLQAWSCQPPCTCDPSEGPDPQRPPPLHGLASALAQPGPMMEGS